MFERGLGLANEIEYPPMGVELTFMAAVLDWMVVPLESVTVKYTKCVLAC